MPFDTDGPIQDPKKLRPIERWRIEIEYAKKELKKFHDRARKVVRRYLDERDAVNASSKWFNLFYANTKIMRAALYSQLPTPEVKRKYLDYNDQLARVAANIIQRCITPDGDDPRDRFHESILNSVNDRLVAGLAQVWLRVETDTEEQELSLESTLEPGEPYVEPPPAYGFPGGMLAPEEAVAPSATPVGEPPAGPSEVPPEGMEQQTLQPPPQVPPVSPPQTVKYLRITDQRIAVDYVYWEDFIWSPCRVWEERRWTGRGVYMSYEQLKARFGEEKAKRVPLSKKAAPMATGHASSTPLNMALETAYVYEIWDRCEMKVIWLCVDYDDILDEKDDFLQLIGFEPCPKPMLANTSTSNTTPRPDFYMCQDQYNELDVVNNRIAMLVQAVKVVGVYDQAAAAIQGMLTEGTDNTLIPVDNWAMFAEKGGIKGTVDFLPLDQIVTALMRLNEAREAIKAQIYELTGIADIVRGASKASETLGAQEIKAKFASVRIKDVQDEVARFASEILRIKAELMVKHFDPEILKRKSNIMHTDDAALADQAIQLIQTEEGFEWRILVTSDQLAQADYAMEKADRIELMTALSGFLQQAGAMIQAKPESTPLLVNLLKWTIAGFKGAKDIEGMLARTLEDMVKNPPQEKPDPKAEAEKAKAEAETQKMQGEMQIAQQKAGLDAQAQQADIAAKQQLQAIEIEAKRAELQFQQQKNAQELQFLSLKHQMDLKMLTERAFLARQAAEDRTVQ